MDRDSLASSERRSFLARLNAGLASLVAMAGVARAQQKPSPATRWEPARHQNDDWLDKAFVKHRLLFDTTGLEGLGNAIAFAENFYRTNKADYGVENSELAVLI